jgi:transcriptional regulator with XRE-family HTH domain
MTKRPTKTPGKPVAGITKAPSNVDRHVGSRVRMRRILNGMSQESLGEALGVTFQQVQKYEKGTNRIGASRLHQIASVLGVPIEFFYEGAPAAPGGSGRTNLPESAGLRDDLITPENLQLLKAFARIRDPKIRRYIMKLTEAVGSEQ